MRNLSDTTGSFGYGEIPGEDGDIATSSTGKDYKDIIRRANCVLITKVFSHYGLRLDSGNRKAVCPFPHHKNGRETSASFCYYPETNTYCCFGCHAGCSPCDFVANMERISKVAAAYKILDLLIDDLFDTGEFEIQNSSERLEIMLDFSDTVRNFRQINIDNNAFVFIEEICRAFDNICFKHKLDNKALCIFVHKLKERISSYIPCPIF